jgi:hypothetical protein
MALVPPRVAVLCGVAALALVGGCAGDLAPGQVTSVAPMAPVAPGARALASWIDGVCASADDLATTARDVVLVMPLEGTDPATAREQVRTRVRERLDVVRRETYGLRVRVDELPPGAAPAFTALRDHLALTHARTQDAVDALAGAVDALADVASPVGDASVVPAARADLPALRASVAATVAEVVAYVADIRRVPSGADAALRKAFAAAPACRPPPVVA